MSQFILGGGATALVLALVAALRVRAQNRRETVIAESADLSESKSAAVLIQLAQGAAVVQSDVIKQVREQLASQAAELERYRGIIPSVEELRLQVRTLTERLEATTTERDTALRENADLRARVNELEAKVESLEQRTPGSPA